MLTYPGYYWQDLSYITSHAVESHLPWLDTVAGPVSLTYRH